MLGIDVAVPCYNYADYLKDCVDSITSQSDVRLRVLIIDNASSDASVETAQELARHDRRISVLARSKNLGPHASYNEGIDWAEADYFTILDADDMLPPGALTRACRFLEAHPNVSFVHGRELAVHLPAGASAAVTNEEPVAWHTSTGAAFIADLCGKASNIVGATTVVRRSRAQKQAGKYRASLPFTDDLEMALRLAMLGDVAVTTAIQGIRRLHGRQATETYRRAPLHDFMEHLAAFESFFANEGASLPNAASLRRLNRETIARDAIWFGDWCMREGRIADAAACTELGVHLSPIQGLGRVVRRVASGQRGLSGMSRYLRAALGGAMPPGARRSPPVAG